MVLAMLFKYGRRGLIFAIINIILSIGVVFIIGNDAVFNVGSVLNSFNVGYLLCDFGLGPCPAFTGIESLAYSFGSIGRMFRLVLSLVFVIPIIILINGYLITWISRRF